MARIHLTMTKLAMGAAASMICLAHAGEARANAPVSQISVSGYACAVETDGSVWCWGPNIQGGLGDGTATDRPTPVQVIGLPAQDPVTQVSVGFSSYVVTTAHRVWAWGNNSGGELGIGTSGGMSTVPVQVTALGANVIQVSAGANGYACAVKSDGSLWCWGANTSGELGDGTTTNRTSPVQVLGVGATAEVSAGSDATCRAIPSDRFGVGATTALDNSVTEPPTVAQRQV